METDVYTVDNKNYLLIDKINNYLYLSNEEDEEYTLILKKDINNTEKLLPLDNEEEVKQALSLFISKEVNETS